MKTTQKIHTIIGCCGLLFATLTTGWTTDYTLTINNSSLNSHWDTAAWSPSGIPGVGDSMTLTTNDATQRFFYIDGTRTINNLTKFNQTGFGTGAILISNGTAGTDSSLTISDTMRVGTAETSSGASLNFRSGSGGANPGRLEVYIQKDFILNNGARVQTAETANYRYLTLQVTGTTKFENGNTNFAVNAFADAETNVDLGHVYFANGLISGASAGISLNGGVLRVRSLETDVSGSFGVIYGSNTNTLEIYGNSGAGTNNVFSSQIAGTLKLQKTGSNLQILSHTNNTYSGGTEINGGVLSIRNASGTGLGRSAITVNDGGTLAGTGIVQLNNANYTTVKSGGSIAPGADEAVGFNSLKFNNFDNKDVVDGLLLKMEEGSAFAFRVDENGGSDQIQFGYYKANSVLFEGGEIALNVMGTLSEDYTYTLFIFKSGGLGSEDKISSGLTGGLVAGTGFGDYVPTFHYDEAGFGGTGIISMTVTAIPEPSVVILALVSALGLMVHGVRRKMR